MTAQQLTAFAIIIGTVYLCFREKHETKENPSEDTQFKKFREYDLDDIIKMYKDNVSLTKIGEKYDMYHSQIINILKKAGVYSQKSTLDRNIEIEKQFNEGLSTKEISKNLNISLQVIRQVLRKSHTHKETGHFDKIQVPNEVIGLYKGGMSANRLSQKFKIDIHPILDFLRKNKVEIRAGGPQKHINKKETVKLYQLGWPIEQIAKRYKVTHRVITRVLQEEGITPSYSRKSRKNE